MEPCAGVVRKQREEVGKLRIYDLRFESAEGEGIFSVTSVGVRCVCGDRNC